MKGQKGFESDLMNQKDRRKYRDHNRYLQRYDANPKGEVRREDGNDNSSFKNAAKVVVRWYQCPFLVSSPMEPMNSLHSQGDKAELIGPRRLRTGARTDSRWDLDSSGNIPVEITPTRQVVLVEDIRPADLCPLRAVQISKLTNASR